MTKNQERITRKCRFCRSPLQWTFVDLGMSPLCESYLSLEQLNQMEPFYPLHVYVCSNCFLVQLDEFVPPEEIFTEYAYFSSYSDDWLMHARRYVDSVIDRFQISSDKFVVELASNDGYLLQYFMRKGIPVLGVEPAVNVAADAVSKGIPTLVKFFGVKSAKEIYANGRKADLIVANNVLAQVPALNDFVGGIKILLNQKGVVTVEFPHLVKLIDGNQFDTIYHEHFSYFSLRTADRIFAAHGIDIFDVEELSTHGGSLRIYGKHAEDGSKSITDAVFALKEKEGERGVETIDLYRSFGEKVEETKRKLLEFLIRAKRSGRRIAAYGAPGKGNTLLNYCGIRTDFLDFTVDRNPYKQGKFLPGTHIPICHPEKILQERPDYVMILPWNFKEEIVKQLHYIREWGGQFIVPIPEVAVIP